jgi:ribosome biogenesis GTPase
MQGLVLKSTGRWYNLLLDNNEIVTAAIRGKIRMEGLKTTNPIAAGDRVEVSVDKNQGDEIHYWIEKVLPRVNYIVRKSTNLSKQMQILAANIDRAYLLVTLQSPVTQPAFVDRFLVAAESFRIPTTILFNKVDIYDDFGLASLEYWMNVYQKIGYQCHSISAEKPETVAFLKDEINGKQVMISGNSGVGKTTLVNSLDNSLELRTGEISVAHEQGKHTTTFAEMHALKTGGFIIDTPGIRAFGLVDLDKEHYAHYFPEMRARLGECKFHNCKHLNEPHCAVKKAVESGEIDGERYLHYCQLMEEDANETYRKNERV